ncbi:hypothetical protein PRIPAC_91252 [Pristionchus pacificus]|uniref:Uncharacterized protein n=1 Tax=Pristionchus pacificus TaxID=54126 RepID=A0A2A6CWY5_PRIPA|nr:hypothetical protein PRIPAC_91252 [Pristionchus pacificus]|eukprot:PDM82543.1 hypothetical protein PRIPAC_36936 [Pristionchus pacificus]
MSTYQIYLSTLPSDVIRKVVNFAGMAPFEEMRLISPRWSETALAHIEVRAKRPVINVCHWWPHNTPGNKRPHDWNMEITIAKEYANYFGLDGWNLSNKPSESDDKVLLNRRLTSVQEPWTRKRIVRLFSRCSKIEKFILDFSRIDDVTSLCETTGGTIIENLEIVNVKELLSNLEFGPFH